MNFSPGGMSPAYSGINTPTEGLSPRPPIESPKRSNQYARGPKADMITDRGMRDNEAIAVAVAAAIKIYDLDPNERKKNSLPAVSLPVHHVHTHAHPHTS